MIKPEAGWTSGATLTLGSGGAPELTNEAYPIQ
jgi:hypothetical protein